MPPAYRDWDRYVREIDFMVRSGVMEDYTYLWYDIRPHPRFGTVEIRCCDHPALDSTPSRWRR